MKNSEVAASDGLNILDKRFGVSADAQSQHQQFSEQAEVAEVLYAARKAAGLTQAQLAQVTGTTQEVVSQLEDADYNGHSLSMLRRIAAALDSHVELRLVPNSTEKAAG
ncbi:MAG: helix-turn-helix transcriptional regulator [Pirellulales bacterium]